MLLCVALCCSLVLLCIQFSVGSRLGVDFFHILYFKRLRFFSRSVGRKPTNLRLKTEPTTIKTWPEPETSYEKSLASRVQGNGILNRPANITLFFVIFSRISFEFESWRSWLKSDWCIEAYTIWYWLESSQWHSGMKKDNKIIAEHSVLFILF